MRWHVVFLLLMGMTWRQSHSTCVFESDFGFTLNCAFKKSSIFRVRNLGGVKGYVGLGFSLGDELGFQQSLSTLESNRRRSTDVQGAAAANGLAAQQSGASKRGDTEVTARSHKGQQSGRQVVPPFKRLPPPVHMPGSMMGNAVRTVPAPSLMNKGGFIAVPAFAALPESIVRIPNVNKPPQPQRPLASTNFQNALQMANRRFQVVGNPPASNSISPNTLLTRTLPTQTAPDKPMSNLVSGIDIYAPSPLLMGHSVHSLSQASNISVSTLAAAIKLRQEQLKSSTEAPATSTTTTTTASPTPTKAPTVRPRYSLKGKHKVMNAPKEYYPVSYDKNFDDNFTSKVELPDTSFSCGDQKHFPGLYADEDLGCMVFHVCAFTDDGLVMKSFLCPESTLFDQTILKCNWWFYVDCKSSKKLYDSNIPISKSYQLMKALAFFSSYRNQSSNAT